MLFEPCTLGIPQMYAECTPHWMGGDPTKIRESFTTSFRDKISLSLSVHTCECKIRTYQLFSISFLLIFDSRSSLCTLMSLLLQQ